MKKLLSVMAVMGLTATSTATAVACGPTNEESDGNTSSGSNNKNLIDLSSKLEGKDLNVSLPKDKINIGKWDLDDIQEWHSATTDIYNAVSSMLGESVKIGTKLGQIWINNDDDIFAKYQSVRDGVNISEMEKQLNKQVEQIKSSDEATQDFLNGKTSITLTNFVLDFTFIDKMLAVESDTDLSVLQETYVQKEYKIQKLVFTAK